MPGVAGGKGFSEDAGTVEARSTDASAIITPHQAPMLGKLCALAACWDLGPSNTPKQPSLTEESGKERGGICLKPVGLLKGLFLAHKK